MPNLKKTNMKIEQAVVETYQKIENKFVGTFLAEEGETVEEAKKRMTNMED